MPIKFLEGVVDAMSYAKLNVLHLHLSDEESFPMQSQTFPDLWSTAFSDGERYTKREMRNFVKYAHMRGVAVLAEIDTPGHSKSMCAGVPSTPDTEGGDTSSICMPTCTKSSNYPLRPIDATFDFLQDLFTEYFGTTAVGEGRGEMDKGAYAGAWQAAIAEGGGADNGKRHGASEEGGGRGGKGTGKGKATGTGKGEHHHSGAPPSDAPGLWSLAGRQLSGRGATSASALDSASTSGDSLASIFPFDMVHIGGDEVVSDCYEDDEVTAAWCAVNNVSSSDVWPMFVNKHADLVSSRFNRSVIAWDDAFNDGFDMDPRIVLMFWQNTDYSEYMRKAAKDGRKIIAAIENPLYLSNYNNYQTREAYEYDPCRITNDNYKNQINTTAECEQVIGMAAAMWTSDFDASNLENSLWPRGFAMAERAWSPSELGAYTNGTASRLGDFRCALMQRGVNVSPLKTDWSYTYGSSERVGVAGSCRAQ